MMRSALNTLFATLVSMLLAGAVWAAKPPETKPVYLPKPDKAQIRALAERVKSELVFFPGGTFQMGDWGDPKSGLPWDYEQDSKPLHPVTLDPFSMMKFKVTYADFDLFTAANGLPQVSMETIARKFRGPRKPAGVSWYGADAYCQWLGKLTGLPFALPTEAQWEYAARSGGREVLFSTDNGQIDPGRNYPAAWQRPAPWGDGLPEVDLFPPNPAGLYAMAIKSREWVSDWYDAEYYARSPQDNPRGPENGKEKVQRGHMGGGLPEMSALTFVRTSAPPRRMDSRINDDAQFVDVPYVGYSSAYADTFRCVVNAATPVP